MAGKKGLRNFNCFFNVEIHKILLPANTRWLSLKCCVDRVLEQYEPLHPYLREIVFSDPSKTTESMVTTMSNKFTRVYLHFLSYVLEILTDFNKLFQSETPLLYKLKPETEKMVKILCLNYLKPTCVRNENNILNHTNPIYFLKLEQIDLGIQATECINDIKQDSNASKADITAFFQNCRQFYIELVSDIKTRFVFTDDIFSIIEIVDPAKPKPLTLSL